jgi:hypothetical protein
METNSAAHIRQPLQKSLFMRKTLGLAGNFCSFEEKGV